MRTLKNHYTLYRNKAAIDQLKSGLGVLGVSEAMSKYPDILEEYFALKVLHIQWNLRKKDKFIHRPMSVIQRFSFIGEFCQNPLFYICICCKSFLLHFMTY